MLKSLLGKSDATCALNKLVRMNLDSDAAYRKAAALVSDADIRTRFLEHAAQRAEFAAELSTKVAELGGQPATSGSLLNKVVIPLRLAFFKLTRADDAKLVASAEAAEDRSRDRYVKALQNQELDEPSRSILGRQMSGLRQSHAAMRELEIRLNQPAGVPEVP